MSAFSQERLTALNAAYARCIDDDLLEQWPDFFLDRCLYLITTADNYADGMQAGIIYADTRPMLQDRVLAMREANVYEQQRYRHIIGAPLLLEQNEEAAKVESPFIVVRTMRDGAMNVFATGCYIDRIVQTPNGMLKFAERVVICDSTNIDTLLVIPL